MSRVSGCLWLSAALILALVAGGAAFVTLQRATVGQAAGQVPVATTLVVVAAHPLPVGALLSEGDLTVQTLPAGAVPLGTLPSIGDASGQVTMVPLNTGELVLTHHLTRPDISAANASFTLPEGKVAVTLAATDLMSNSEMVQAGDHVDILYSMKIKLESKSKSADGSDEQSGDQQYTFGSLQNVTVVSVVRNTLKENASQDKSGATAAAGAPRAYVLALPPQDALTLKYLRDATAVMDLALRNVNDETDHTAKPVDIKYIVDKYQLPVCQPAACGLPIR